MKIGDRIKLIRAQQKLSQEVMCNELRGKKYTCCIDSTTLSRYETNRRTPDILFLKDFCNCYHVNAQWLLCEEGDIYLATDTKKDANTAFLELSNLLKMEEMKPMVHPPIINELIEEITQDTAENFVHLLTCMHQDAHIRSAIFKFFYFFVKPAHDRLILNNQPKNGD